MGPSYRRIAGLPASRLLSCKHCVPDVTTNSELLIITAIELRQKTAPSVSLLLPLVRLSYRLVGDIHHRVCSRDVMLHRVTNAGRRAAPLDREGKNRRKIGMLFSASLVVASFALRP